MADQDDNKPDEQKQDDAIESQDDETNSKKIELDDIDDLDRLEEQNKDMNSTMMAIDAGDLDFDNATSTRINVDGEEAAPTDEQIIQEKLDQKKSFLSKLITKLTNLKKSKPSTPSKKISASKVLRKIEGVWWPPIQLNTLQKIVFVISRVLIVLGSVFAYQILFEQLDLALKLEDQLKYYLMGGLGLSILFSLLALFLRWAPTWILTLPVSILVFWAGAVDYFIPNASKEVYQFSGLVLSESWNLIFLFGLSVVGLIFLAGVLQKVFSRIILAFVLFLPLIPFAFNQLESIPLVQSFFGVGFFQEILPAEFQPVSLAAHAFIPLVFLLIVFFSFLEKKKGASSFRFARSLLIPTLLLNGALFVLLSLYFVPQVFDLVLSPSSKIGVAEMKLDNGILRVESKHYNRASLDDESAWLNLDLKSTAKPDEFFLYVQTPRQTPLPTFQKNDLRWFWQKDLVKQGTLKLLDVNEKGFSKYVFKTSLPEVTAAFEIVKPQRQYSTKDSLVLQLTKGHNLEKIVIKINSGKSFFEKLLAKTDQDVKIPFFSLAPGDYQFTIEGLGSEDNLIETKQLAFQLAEQPAVQIVYPLTAGFQKGRQIVLQNIGFDSSQVELVTFKWGDDILFETNSFQNIYQIPNNDVSLDGDQTLSVDIKLSDMELSDSIALSSKPLLAGFDLLEPQMGGFISENVTLRLAAGADQLKSVSFFLNGELFENWEQKNPTEYQLNLSQWKKNQLYLSVLVESVDGKAASFWTQLNRGQGRLQLMVDDKKLDFLKKRQLVVLIDSSNTTRDAWQGRSVLNQSKDLLVDPTIVAQLNQLDLSVLSSNEQKIDSKGCALARDVFVGSKISVADLRKDLETLSSAGEGGALNLLKKSFDEKADQIVYLTDGLSQCDSKRDLQKWVKLKGKSLPLMDILVLSHNQKTSSFVDVFEGLEQVKVHYPQSREFLHQQFLELLSVQVQILKDEKIVWRGLLKDQYIELAPGSYKMKVVSGADQREFDFNILNSIQTKMTLSSKDDSLFVQLENLEIK